MDDQDRRRLGELLRVARARKDLSAKALGRLAGVDHKTVRLLELGRIRQPRLAPVQRLAQALSIPLSEVYAVMHWLPPEALPTIGPYMRAKYSELPSTAVDEVENFVNALASRYELPPEHEEHTT